MNQMKIYIITVFTQEFIIGLFVGAILGVVVMCCCYVASKADDEIEKMENEQTDDKEDS